MVTYDDIVAMCSGVLPSTVLLCSIFCLACSVTPRPGCQQGVIYHSACVYISLSLYIYMHIVYVYVYIICIHITTVITIIDIYIHTHNKWQRELRNCMFTLFIRLFQRRSLPCLSREQGPSAKGASK